MSPKEAIQAHLDLASKQSIAIHFGTFQLGDEGIEEPKLELEKELKIRHIPQEQFLVLLPGEGKQINPN